MAKLKCDLHSRRVFALNGHFIHRGGWGDVCKSETATIGDKQYKATEMVPEARAQVKAEEAE